MDIILKPEAFLLGMGINKWRENMGHYYSGMIVIYAIKMLYTNMLRWKERKIYTHIEKIDFEIN